MELCGSPCALALAAGSIAYRHRFTLDEKLGILRRQRQVRKGIFTNIDWTKYTSEQDDLNFSPVWDLALTKLSSEGRELMDTLVFMDPDGIPEASFRRDVVLAMPSSIENDIFS